MYPKMNIKDNKKTEQLRNVIDEGKKYRADI